MKHLVTGGAGFIGSNLVRTLVEAGESVRVLDNLATGRLENIRDLLEKAELVEGDIRDAETVKQAVDGVKYVFHLAALPSVAKSVEDPVSSNEVNVAGTLNMLVAARDAGVKRFVFSSSSSVYGDTPTLPKREDMTPAPLSPYAVQKLAAEHYCRIFHELYGLRTFALRFFNVFGPRQNPESQYAAVIPAFIKALKGGNSPLIHGDGNQTRDFTFIADVVNASIRCCHAPPETAGKAYNVARGARTSINELARLLADIMGRNIKPVHDEPRNGDVRDSQADATRIREAVGWKPEVELYAGLKRTVEWFSKF